MCKAFNVARRMRDNDAMNLVMKRAAWLLSDSIRALARDWRAGELRLLLVAVVVAVAALSSVSLFADRLRNGLQVQALQMLGADLVIAADNPFDPALATAARAQSLKSVGIQSFPSMVQGTQAGQMPQLAGIKAVEAGYPLRGALSIIQQPGAAAVSASTIPASGTVWVDPALALALGVDLNGHVQLGERQFVVAAFIALEPDRGTSFMSLAPRLLMNAQDLASTQLVQPGSRISYRLQLAGPSANVAAFQKNYQLARGQRFESLEGGRPELRNTLDRAEKFLSLVSLITALIAACALAMGAQRYASRHLDAFAVQRALGAQHRSLVARTVLELFWIALAGGVVGVLLGFAAQQVLVSILGSLLRMPLPMPGWLPAVQSGLAGVLLLLGFSLLPIVRVAGVSPLQVLRRDLGAPPMSAALVLVVALGSFCLLMLWITSDWKLALVMLGGVLACVALFALLSWLCLRLVLRLAGGLGSNRLMNARFGLVAVAIAAWKRRQFGTVSQTTALALAMLALVLLTVTRNDLLDSWRAATPPNAPNRFVLNVQPDQAAPLAALLANKVEGGVELYPMVRGRLIAVNGTAVGPDQLPNGGQSDRAARMLDRELNLSYMAQEPSHNKTVQGRWIQADKAEVSVEQGIAQSLGLRLGDRLRFDVAGEQFEANVVGIRKLAWDSMKINFFMIVSPAALNKMPQTFVSAIHLPKRNEAFTAELLKQMPNLTIFDASQISAQVRQIIDQISTAVQFLFLFTLIAGVLVMYASQVASRDERMQQAALMRTMGASRQQLSRAQWWELSFLGGLAGGMAALGALAIGAVLAREIFEFPLLPNWWAVPVAMLVAAACSLTAGWFGLRGVLNAPPLQTLRNV